MAETEHCGSPDFTGYHCCRSSARFMRGGKRIGAGRKRGPSKKQLTVRVLPETLAEINRRSATLPSIGALFDNDYCPRQVTCFTPVKSKDGKFETTGEKTDVWRRIKR